MSDHGFQLGTPGAHRDPRDFEEIGSPGIEAASADALAAELATVSPAAIAEARATKVLGPATLMAGLGAGLGLIAQALLELQPFRPFTLACYLVLVGLGAWWWRRPQRHAQLKLFLVSVVLLSAIGRFMLSSAPDTLLHLSIVSFLAYLFISDRRLLVVNQLLSLVWFGVGLYVYGGEPRLLSLLIVYALAMLAGVFSHFAQRREDEALHRARRQLQQAFEERSAALDQVAEARKLESLGVMAGGVAHDFNNLLVGILGGVDLARTVQDDPVARNRALQQVQLSAEAAETLCRQILEVSGGQSAVLAPTDLAAVIQDSVSLVSAKLSSSIELVVEVSAGLPPVSGDRGRLLQLFQNLLTNACEAAATSTAAEGGKVIVGAAVTPIAAGQSATGHTPPGEDAGGPRSQLLAWVEDNGPGVDPAVRARIFDPFYSTKPAGRGLGLALVAAAIRAHGGSLSLIDASPGSRFELRLPSSAQPIAESAAVAESTGLVLAGRLLLVDDEAAVRHVAGQMAESAGLSVLAVASGAEAIAALKAEPLGFDLALIDMTMPNMSGLDAAGQLAQLDPALPIIMSSGYSVGGAESQAMKVGLRFLAKPYTRAELLAGLAEALALKSVRTPAPGKAPLQAAP